MPLDIHNPVHLENPGTFKGGNLAYGQTMEGLAIQHVVSVDDLATGHNLTHLADLAISKDTDLDHGPRGEGLTIQPNHGYISYLCKDNHGRVAIFTARANLADHILSPHAYSLPSGHPTCRFTDVTNDTPTEDELGEAAPAGLITLA